MRLISASVHAFFVGLPDGLSFPPESRRSVDHLAYRTPFGLRAELKRNYFCGGPNGFDCVCPVGFLKAILTSATKVKFILYHES